MAWTWQYEPAGSAADPSPSFPSQADAESWIGETWRELLDAGVESVSLFDDDREVYGGMGLRPA